MTHASGYERTMSLRCPICADWTTRMRQTRLLAFTSKKFRGHKSEFLGHLFKVHAIRGEQAKQMLQDAQAGQPAKQKGARKEERR